MKPNFLELQRDVNKEDDLISKSLQENKLQMDDTHGAFKLPDINKPYVNPVLAAEMIPDSLTGGRNEVMKDRRLTDTSFVFKSK